MPPKKIDKGKAVDRTGTGGRERVPLLGEASSSARPAASYATIPRPDETSPARRRRSWNDLLVPAIAICSILLAACLFVLLLAYSFVPSDTEKADIPSALRWNGPTKIDIVNVTDDGIWVNVEGEYGVDLDRMLGIRRIGESRVSAVENGWRGAGAQWWESVRASVGDRLVPMVGDLEVRVPSPIEIYSTAPAIRPNQDSPLVVASLPSVFSIDPSTFLPAPSSDSSESEVSLRSISSLVHVQPISDMSKLMQFAQEGWKTGWVNVEVRVPLVEIGPNGADMGLFGWRKLIKREKKDISIPMRFELSRIPGLPARNTNHTDLISLRSYSLATRNASATNATTVLGIIATATAPNIVPEMRFEFPYQIGFAISLPVATDGEDEQRIRRNESLFKMAEVFTRPLTLEGQDPITVHIEGEIVGDLNQGRTLIAGDTPLSTFLRNYLHGRDNVVTVMGSPEVTESLAQNVDKPPKWLMGALPHIELSVPFPAPKDSPKLIRSVTIEDMRISQSAGKMVATGTVLAEIQLPADFAGVKVDVKGVRPDVLVYDGPASADGPDCVPEEPPYPPKAFGRINPGYLDAESVVSEEEPDILIVRAPLDHVPLEILAGRDAVLSDFVSKVIFKGGAVAGVKGVASVEVQINGVAGVVELESLGVNGEVKVGKPR